MTITYQLSKFHGLGNDFLVLLGPEPQRASRLAVLWCDRRTGVGADGLIIGAPEIGYDARFILYNADGSRAEMSGNGIRCLAQALVRAGADPATGLRIATDAGDRVIDVTPSSDPSVICATVDMGLAELIEAPSTWHLLDVSADRPVMHVSVGNPHAVVLTDDVAAVELAELGRLVPNINLEIIEPGPGSGAITMRVHERGAGITPACGTGAVASAYAASTWGIVDSEEVVVHQPGGSARVRIGERLTLIGPSIHIADLTVTIREDQGEVSA